MKKVIIITIMMFVVIGMTLPSIAQEDQTTKVLKTGLVGAGTGALAAGMSGGQAGKGALIGAGTGIIGSVLLDAITGTGQQRQPARYEEQYYPEEELDEYYTVPQEDATTQVLKQGLVGAGTGAIASGVSGGKVGEGAIIGAGTNVIGNALLDAITRPTPQRQGKVYRRTAPQVQQAQPRTKTIRKYDENGNLIYEEIVPIE